MFISWMLIMPSFQKSLIVDQFQGNYLKQFFFRYHFSLFSSSGLQEARPSLGGEVIYFSIFCPLSF